MIYKSIFYSLEDSKNKVPLPEKLNFLYDESTKGIFVCAVNILSGKVYSWKPNELYFYYDIIFLNKLKILEPDIREWQSELRKTVRDEWKKFWGRNRIP